MRPIFSIATIVFFLSVSNAIAVENPSVQELKWVSLFNGKNLEGWTIKIAKHPLGENYKNTFIVEDGILKVDYKNYEKFDGQFGHLYSNQSYSHYKFRVDYKFVGRVMADAPSWTSVNSGVMLHAQSPFTLGLDQSFPVSLEGQFLGLGTSAGTQTANVCTPGTDIVFNGKLTKAHIVDSSSKLYPQDEWVTFEAEVHGNREIIYRVNSKEVLRFNKPQLDSTDPDAKRLLVSGARLLLDHGHIALQAEAQPVWFKNIYIMPLDED